MSRRHLYAALCVTTGIAVACMGIGEEPTAPEARRFTLVYNVNNSGYVNVCGCEHKEVRQGSLTRRSSFLRQLRATGRELLLVDGGSSLFPAKDRVKEREHDEAVRKAEVIVRAYNHMGYHAMAVGAFDIAAGLDTLKDLEKKAGFKLLSANLADKRTGELYFEPHAVFEIGDVQVGVIGLTLSTLSRPYLEKVAPNAKLLDPYESAKKSLEELRDQVDIVVALSHLRQETNFELVEKLQEIEILVDPFVQYGSHHTWIKENEWVTPMGDTLFLRGDGQGARLGVVDVEIRRPRSPLLSEESIAEAEKRVEANEMPEEELERLRQENQYRFTRVSLEPHHLTDPALDRLVGAWQANRELPAIDEAVQSSTPYATHLACKACHEKQYENWLTTSHAHAYDSLKKTNEQHRFDCVGCHALGYGQAFVDTRKVGEYANVQCESCHGANPAHLTDAEKNPYGKVSRMTCISCHNKEVLDKDFYFSVSRPKVACPKG